MLDENPLGMKTVVFSDLHGNFQALEALCSEHGEDFWICLGDVLGRLGDMMSCLEVLRSRKVSCVRGNHETDLWQIYEPSLTQEMAVWVKSWPHQLREGETLLNHCWLDRVHTGFRFQRVENLNNAEAMFASETFQRAFVGHSHRPGWWEKGEGAAIWTSAQVGQRLEWRPGVRYIVDVGSLGDPEFPQDPRWVVWDARGVTWAQLYELTKLRSSESGM